MTVGDPESGAEGHEQSCVEFYGRVYRLQTKIDPQQRRRCCRPGTETSAAPQHSIQVLQSACLHATSLYYDL